MSVQLHAMVSLEYTVFQLHVTYLVMKAWLSKITALIMLVLMYKI